MPRFVPWRLLGVLTLLVAPLGPPPAARAEDEVRVTVVTILATDRNDKVDRRLKCVAEEVRKVYPGLTGFQIYKTTCTPMEVGKTVKVALVEKATAEVTVQRGTDKDNRVRLEVKAPKMGEMVYISCCGKFFPIVTRYQTRDKEQLIVAIRVQPCKH